MERGWKRTEELPAGVIHPCKHHANAGLGSDNSSKQHLLGSEQVVGSGAARSSTLVQALVCSPQLCMTARVRLTTSEVNTCSPVMGHTPPFASVPATAAMILHVACVCVQQRWRCRIVT